MSSSRSTKKNLAKVQIVLPETIDPDLEQFAETWRKDRPYTPRKKS